MKETGVETLRETHQIGSRTREWLVHPSQCRSLSSYGILLAGISLGSSQFRFVRRAPKIAQVLVGLSGCGTVWVEGAWKKCAPGMAYITPAGQAHAYHATGAKPWKVAWVIYGIAPVPHHPNLPSVAKPILCEVDPRPWEQAVQGLIVESSRSGDPVLLEHWTGLVHGYAVQMMQRNHSSRLWRLWQSVQADLSLPWTLDGLARNSGFDKENLRRICLSETGRSPMQQVTRLRMQHAVSLLASDQKVQAVAEAVGYENVFAFSTAFKRQMGRSPKEFRPLG